MIRLLLLVSLLLSACAKPRPVPVVEPVDCAAPDEQPPIDGGIGGTGNAPGECPPI